jgi:hypothetical protein
MIVQPKAASGDGIAADGDALPLEHVSSYWEVVHSNRQVSVPPETAPSAETVAPLLTAQLWSGGPGRQPTLEASSYVFAPGG